MNSYIVLLRGVMPVGKNKVPMAQLREVLTDAGFGGVRTYIQSGNVFVDTELSTSDVERRIHEQIVRHIGPSIVVIARTRSAIREAFNSNPFEQGYDSSRVFFVLFAETPAADKVKELLNQDFGDEKLVIGHSSAVMYIPGQYGKGRLSNNFLEKQLGISATMRNFNTMSKLIELSGDQYSVSQAARLKPSD